MTKGERHEQPERQESPQFDDILKRMLSSPPKQHKDETAKPKPAGEPAKNKPAK